MLWLLACSPPTPAPDRLEELLGFLFQRVPDEDTAELEDGAGKLASWMSGRVEETLEGYEIDPLTDEQLASAGFEDVAFDLTGVSVGFEHAAGLEALVDALLVPPTERRDNFTSYERQVNEGTEACFSDGSCDYLELETWAVKELGLGVVEDSHMRLQYRRLDTEHGPSVIYRAWAVEPPEWTTDLLSIDQSLFLWGFVPDGAGQLRSMQAGWVQATSLDSELDYDVVLQLWINGMVKAAEDLEAWALGT